MSKSLPPVVAVHRIDGTILPGTVFTPTNAKQHADLVRMGAVREPTEAELLLHEKMTANAAKTDKPQLDHDGDGKAGGSKPRGGRQSKAEKEAAAKAATEAEGNDGDDGDNADADNDGEGGDDADADAGADANIG